MHAKDQIARELLDLDDEAAETIDEAYAREFEASAGLESRAGEPAFLNDKREADVDILTGDAE